nr:odorant receptor SameORX [Schistocerca americana]
MVCACYLAVVAFAASQLLAEPWRPLEELAIAALIFVTGSSFTFKGAMFLRYRPRLLQLATQLCGGGLRPDVGAETRRRYRQRGREVFLYLQAILSAPTLLWSLQPLLVPPGGSVANLSNMTEPALKRSTPLPMWLPPALQSSPAYEMVYGLQVFSMLVVLQTSVFTGIFFLVLMLSIAAELHVLNDSIAGNSGQVSRSPWRQHSLSTMESHRATEVDAANDGAVTSFERSHLQRQMYCDLANNIRHHQLIIRCVKELEAIMNLPIFVLLFLHMVNICAQIFVTSLLLQKDNDSTTLFKVLFTLPIYLYETGLYCVFGQIIIDQSDRLSSSAYSGTWLQGDVRLRRALLLLTSRAVHPLTLTVGKTYTLSRHTFLQILNGSYSLFNMLYQVQGNK